MNNITAINNNANSVRIRNNSGYMSKQDAITHFTNTITAKHFNVIKKCVYVSHAITGENRIKHRTPKKLDYICHITQTIPIVSGYDNLMDDAFYNNIIVFGTRNRNGYNVGEYAKLFSNLESAICNYGSMLWDLESPKDNDFTDETDVISYYLDIIPSDYELHMILNKCDYYRNNNSYSEYEFIADLMTILTPETWIHETITGCIQGEYANIIYPAKHYTRKDIETFTCYWFGYTMNYRIQYKEDDIFYTFTDNTTEKEIFNTIASDFNIDPKQIRYTPYF